MKTENNNKTKTEPMTEKKNNNNESGAVKDKHSSIRHFAKKIKKPEEKKNAPEGRVGTTKPKKTANIPVR